MVVNGQLRVTAAPVPAAEQALGEAVQPAPVTRFRATGGAAFATNRISTIEGTFRVGATNEQFFRAVRTPPR